jgi:SPT2 chromatin protein.
MPRQPDTITVIFDPWSLCLYCNFNDIIILISGRIESDSEYDSELDDFIVDDNDAEVDISKEISSIFGYDRNK